MGFPFELPAGITLADLWTWLTKRRASLYYHEALRVWIASDDHTARMGNSPEQALYMLAFGRGEFGKSTETFLKKQRAGKIPPNAKEPPSPAELDALSALQNLGCSASAEEDAIRRAREHGAPGRK